MLQEGDLPVLNAMLCMTRQCWEQGILAQALMELGEWDLLALTVQDMVQRQGGDGRLCIVEQTPAITDSAFCIPAVFEAGIRFGREDYLDAAVRNVRFLLSEAPRAADGTLYHLVDTKEIWADSAAFLPFSFARLGYVEEAYRQMAGICSRLYDPASGLYFHMWEEQSGQFLRPLAWGIGNGWILTGMMRLYLETPDDFEKKGQLHQAWLDLLDKMLSFLTENSLFHDILQDNTTYEESECASMVAYSIYRGVMGGMLEFSYAGTADQISAALEKKITKQGFVSDSAGSPDFTHPGVSVESQAHFLMMRQAKRMMEHS